MSRAVHVILSMVIALLGGAASARIILDEWPMLGAERSGVWRLVESGDADDPYFRAISQAVLRLPAGPAEGRTYRATMDDSGEALRDSCDYTLSGETPVARLFTLRVETPDGRRSAAPDPLPAALHSDQMVYSGTRFAVSAAREAKPGNWLAVRSDGAYALVLSIYDVSVSSGDFGGTLVLPGIKREACR